MFSAWRWAFVARGLRIRLALGTAVAGYYSSLFLNAALPGGVLGDVHRAVQHGRSAGDPGRGVRAGVLERGVGQVVLGIVAAVMLPTMPSPGAGPGPAPRTARRVGFLGVLAVVLAIRPSQTPTHPNRARACPPRAVAEAREALLSRRNGSGVLVLSLVVLAGHLAMFLLAARVAGSEASVAVLLPIAVPALLVMGCR